jgi:zinc/manganese transport system substrate-binding protein
MQHTSSDKLLRRALAALATFLIAGSAQALSVFTCGPEWAALVRELAPSAEVRSATHARQNPHNIDARPSLIASLRRADLAVCTGAGLEAAWLPTLQQRAGNAKVQDGAPGMVYASWLVPLIDARTATGSPFEGDVHAEGNPHVHLDPRRVLTVARALTERLQQIDPAQTAAYAARGSALEAAWRQRIAAWEQKAAPLRGMRVAAQHTSYAYLWGWLGIEQVADLEPKPGLPPTPAHLQRLLSETRTRPPAAVVVSGYQDPRSAEWLAQQLGGRAAVLQLPGTVTEEPPANTLAGMFDHMIEQLLAVRR